MIRAIFRRIAPARAYARAGAMLNTAAGVRVLGLREWRRLRNTFPDRWRGPAEDIAFIIPPLLHPITVRAGTSDSAELVHTVLRACYGVHLPAAVPRTIIDAGANIGDSTAWYLSRFPEARVYALEPDAENFALLQRNCARYGDRCVTIQAALWPRDGSVVLGNRDSHSGIVARDARAGETAECEAISMTTLLERYGIDRVDIFKCDIEGAETEVFRNAGEWVGRVGAVYADAHGAAAIASLRAALAGFQYRRHRELHIFRR